MIAEELALRCSLLAVRYPLPDDGLRSGLTRITHPAKQILKPSIALKVDE